MEISYAGFKGKMTELVHDRQFIAGLLSLAILVLALSIFGYVFRIDSPAILLLFIVFSSAVLWMALRKLGGPDNCTHAIRLLIQTTVIVLILMLVTYFFLGDVLSTLFSPGLGCDTAVQCGIIICEFSYDLSHPCYLVQQFLIVNIRFGILEIVYLVLAHELGRRILK